jgi:hypothetical protein
MTHPPAVVDLTIAEQSEMRVLMQLHRLHPIQAVHDFQTMETNNRVLQIKTHSNLKLPSPLSPAITSPLVPRE